MQTLSQGFPLVILVQSSMMDSEWCAYNVMKESMEKQSSSNTHPDIV